MNNNVMKMRELLIYYLLYLLRKGPGSTDIVLIVVN